jgi:hypothetical protein
MGRLSRRTNKTDKGTNLYDVPFLLSGDTGVHVFIDESGNVTQIKKNVKERLRYYIDPSIQFEFLPECVIGVSGGGDKKLYKFSTDTTNSDPGNGYLKFNSSYDVTEIYISDNCNKLSATTSGSTIIVDPFAITDWINKNIVNDGSIYIKVFNSINQSHIATFDISGITYNTGWFTIYVEPIIDFFSFMNEEEIYFTYEQSSCTYGIGLGIGDNQFARATYT